MSPQLEVVLIVAATVCTACAVVVTWAVIRAGRDPTGWTTAANHLAQRLTDHENRLTDLEDTVDALLGPVGSTGLTGAVAGKGDL